MVKPQVTIIVNLRPGFGCCEHSDRGKWHRKVQRRHLQHHCLQVQRQARMEAAHRMARQPTHHQCKLYQTLMLTVTVTCQAISIQYNQLHTILTLKYTNHFITMRCTVVQSMVLLSHVICLSVRLCPSVCLSVTLVDHDHIGWKSWKLIVRTISPTSSLFVAQTYSKGNMEKFWGD